MHFSVNLGYILASSNAQKLMRIMPLVIEVFRFSASAGDMAANRSLLISQADVFERGNSQSVLRIVSIADRRWCCDGEAEIFLLVSEYPSFRMSDRISE